MSGNNVMMKVLILSVVILLSIGLNAQNASSDSVAVSLIMPLTKTDFISKVMDYDKNPETWVYKGHKPCVIFFYNETSASCKTAASVLEELALEYQGKVDFYKVNIEKEKELMYVLEVKSIPSFMFCPLKGNPRKTMGVANNNKKLIKQTFRSDILKIIPVQ